MIKSGARYMYMPGLFCPMYPLDGVSTLRNMAARCMSVGYSDGLSGKHVDIIY